MVHETSAHNARGADAANEELMPRDRRPDLADAVITPPRLAGCDAGVIWIDARHDPHWVATDDPDFEHLVALLVHAGHLEDPDLRAMIEELVAPRIRATLAERRQKGARAGAAAAANDLRPPRAREHRAPGCTTTDTGAPA